MAFTSADLAVIEEAISKGTLEVKMANGNEVKYASMADLLALRSKMQQELGIADPTSGIVTVNPNTGL